MRKVAVIGATATIIALLAGKADAAVILPGDEAPLAELLDSLFTVDPNIDPNTAQTENDGLFSLTAPIGSATILFEIAGNAPENTFGIYDPASFLDSQVQLFGGDSEPFDTVSLTFGPGFTPIVDGVSSGNSFASEIFGFYLSGPGGAFFSQPALNEGGEDQFVTIFGDGSLTFAFDASTFRSIDAIIAVEDLPAAASDRDYNDFVLLARNVRAVPEPATVALLLVGLASIGVVGWWTTKRSVLIAGSDDAPAM